MGVQFNYYLVGRGSSACSISIDEQSAQLTASYLSDALGDLVRAVVDILGTAKESSASFAEEPGEYRWLLSKPAAGRVRVRILWFGDDPNPPDHPPDRIELDAECRLRTFAGAVLAGAHQVLRAHGDEGCFEVWNYPFPTEQVARLKSLLDAGAGREPAGDLTPFIGTLTDDEAANMQREIDDACGTVSGEW